MPPLFPLFSGRRQLKGQDENTLKDFRHLPSCPGSQTWRAGHPPRPAGGSGQGGYGEEATEGEAEMDGQSETPGGSPRGRDEPLKSSQRHRPYSVPCEPTGPGLCLSLWQKRLHSSE